MSYQGKAAITGIGELKPTKRPEGRTVVQLYAAAAREAIIDAGLEKRDIDGLLVTTPMEEFTPIWVSAIAEYLQIHPAYLGSVDLGGASAAGMVWRAAQAIASGTCRHVLCITADIWDTTRFYERKFFAPYSKASEFESPYGPLGVTSGYALIAQRHMYEYGTTAAQMAKIAVDQRTNACINPTALFYGQPLTVDDVLNSPLIVDPLHLLEIVLPCSGGAALVVSAAEYARELPYPPVYLLGAGEHSTHFCSSMQSNLTTSAIKVSAARAYEMAGVKPSDFDLLSLYDCFTITVLITLEDAGFCPKGQAGRFVEETDLTYQGSLPCNTHGGQLSWGQPGLAGGMSHITEAARQLMGRAEQRQIRDCQLALVNGNGGIMSEQCTLVLGR
ncbi:MAG: thiolase family protein [Bacillota bacterium]